MTMLNFSAVGTLMMYVDEVTQAQVDRLGTKIGKNEAERVVSNIAKHTLLPRLWVAMVILKAKASEMAAKALIATDDHTEKQLVGEEAQLLHLSRLAGHLFWYELNDLIGWDIPYDLGIRDGWDVVERKPDPPGNMIRTMLLGGGPSGD